MPLRNTFPKRRTKMIKIYNYEEISIDEIFARDIEDTSSIEKTVSEIIDNVKKNGDKALFEYADKFDGGAPDSLLVSEEEAEE